MSIRLLSAPGEHLLDAHLKHFKQPAPDRFQVFGGVDWSQWQEKGNAFPEWAAGRLRAQKARGAQGLKIWKGLGLLVKDHTGRLVDVDDPRLAPIWETAGELGLPVLIHVADPVAFFDPIDETNERWEELGEHPDWAFTSPPFPPFMHIMDGLAALVTRHANTTFIGAHVGCYAENLGWVGARLDRCPNFYVDISARIGELVLARAESFASRNSLPRALLDGFAMGLGFMLVLLVLGASRELLGRGTLGADMHLLLGENARGAGLRIFDERHGLLLALLPPGAFLLLGLMLAWRNRRPQKGA